MATTTPDPRAGAAPPAPKVLIVDDEPRNLDALEAMLEPLGCACVRAHSGNDALLCLLREDVAAIVLDIRMPGIDGIELATLIKQRKRSQHVPILFLTAHMVDDSDILRGYGVGAVDYLSKPINGEILRSKVGVFVDLFRKTRALAEVNDALQREIGDREQAQDALRLANEELEARVRARTAELTEAHQGMAEREVRWRLAIDVASMGAWERDLASGRVTWSTDPEALFGLPAGSLGAHRSMATLVHLDDKGIVETAIATAMATGAYHAEYRAIRPDGSVIWLTESGRVGLDGDQRPERMVGITRDVTAEREAVRQRERLLRDAREARDEAEAASRAKDEFLAMMSHELRNPLNVIAAGLSILESAADAGDGLARTRQVIGKQVRHLATLMDDLLDIARVTSGKVVLNRAPLDLGATVERCLAPLGGAEGRDQHRWETEFEPVWVNGDETRIEQILTNVVGNAIKFTPEGGLISVRVTADDRHAVVRVTDSGVGIAPDLLPRMFDVFVQGDRRVDRPSSGLGLGLALVRRLTELHDGAVTAASDGPGRGASITIRLPRIPAPAPVTSRSTARPAFARQRILLVEDNADARDMLRVLLELQGHEVHVAMDGDSALARARECRPTVALVDIGLPDMDGYAVAEKIRAAEHGRGVRLIALTGYGSEQDRQRAASAGFDAHLTKPVEPERLTLLLAGAADTPPAGHAGSGRE